MLSSKNTVPIPESGIIIRRTGKYKYVYKVLATFRNKKNQPTNTCRLIGRLNEDGDRLVPNDSYYEFYTHESETEFKPEIENVISVGATFLVENILTRLGAVQCLEEALGTRRAHEVVTAVSYMVCEGNVFEHVSDWCERALLGSSPLSLQKASSLFASVTPDEKMRFFRGWVTHTHKGYLAYDVTSFSSYAQGVSDLEWGYNRDGDKLPQINMGCYLSQENSLPLFYVTYPGSIVDKSQMPNMMAYNKELNIQGIIVFVLDRGFCSTKNIRFMHSEGIHYVMGVDASHKATKAAIDSVRDQMQSTRNMLGKTKDGMFAVTARSTFYGEHSTMHVYYNHELVFQQRNDLMCTIDNYENELKQLSTISANQIKKFSRFFDIKVKEGKLIFSRNYDKIDRANQNCGTFSILTNTNLTSTEVLNIYKKKDTIEKRFDDVKNHIDIKRLRAHTDATITGKIFCAFVALIADSEMSNKLKVFNETNKQQNLCKRGMVSELEKIRVLITPTGRRLMNPITKKQRELFEAFGVGENDLNTYILNA